MENVNDYDKQIENIKKKIVFLFQAQKYELAIKEAEKLFEYDPDNYTAWCYTALCYDYTEKYEEALSAALAFLKIYPQSYQAYGVCGRIYLDRGEYQKSINYCQKAVELNADASFYYYTMSFALKKIGGRKNLYKAANLVLKALEIEPDEEEFHLQASAIYVHIGEYYKAKQEGEKALEINPNSARAHLNYGFALIYLGYLDESIEHFYTSLQLDPNETQARKNIDVVKGYINEPLRYYNYLEQRFFNVDLKYPNSSKAFIVLAEIFIREKKYFNALKVFMRYLYISPHEVDEHIKYGKVLYDNGAVAEALYYLKALKRMNKNKSEIDGYIESVAGKMKEKKIGKIYFCNVKKINSEQGMRRIRKIWFAFTMFVLIISILKCLI